MAENACHGYGVSGVKLKMFRGNEYETSSQYLFPVLNAMEYVQAKRGKFRHELVLLDPCGALRRSLLRISMRAIVPPSFLLLRVQQMSRH